MPDKDLYAILGVSKNATPDELKAAFRKLAKEHHPDVHTQEKKHEAEEKFKEMAEAYRVLSDPNLRETYDRYGYDALKRGAAGGGFDMDFDVGDIFGGLFDDFFGFDIGGGRGQRGGRGAGKGQDLRRDVNIDFLDASTGKTLEIDVDRKETCEVCKGEGIKPGTTRKTCKTCRGSGKIRQTQGFFTMVTTCPTCRGAGEIPEALCDSCKGKGVKARSRKIEVKVPAGVQDGQFLKMGGEGDAGQARGYNGDLYVGVHISGHEYFKREEDDVALAMPITISQATLGDEVEVPTLYGTQKISIQPGSQNGQIITLKGQGFPRLNSISKGDMRVTLEVEVPRNPNSKLKEAIKSVKLSENTDDYPKVRDFKRKTSRPKR